MSQATSLDTNQIHGNLWIGSHPSAVSQPCDARNYLDHCSDHTGHRSPLVENGFDVLVLCADSWQPDQPEDFPGVEVIHAPFDDSYSLTKREFDIAMIAAQEIAEKLPNKKCLVTCWAGLNRSGLVSAMALALWKNISPSQAAAVVQSRRSNALCNTHFMHVLQVMSEKKCDLCKGTKLTKRYYEDDLCWVADCRDCGPLMVVYKSHTTEPGSHHKQHMVGVLRAIGKQIDGEWKLDLKRRSIPDHWHAHLRKNA